MGRGLSDLQKTIIQEVLIELDDSNSKLKEWNEEVWGIEHVPVGYIERERLYKRLQKLDHSPQAISRAISRLQDRGYLFRKTEWNKGSAHHKIYVLPQLSSIG